MKKQMSISFWIMVLLIGCSGIACAKQRSESRPSRASNSTSQSTAGKSDSERRQDDSQHIKRKLIRSGELNIRIKNYKTFSSKLQEKLSKNKGYIADVRVSRRLYRVSNAKMTLRIPSKNFDSFLSWLKQQGNNTYERLHSKDITSAYMDLEAHLNNAKRLEQRFLKLLDKKAEKLKDIVAVERELSRVRAKIEQMEGKKKMWSRLVAFATLQLQVSIDTPYSPEKVESFSSQLNRSFQSSLRELSAFVKGSTILLISLIPWLPLIFIAYLIVRLIRKKRKQKKSISKSNKVENS